MMGRTATAAFSAALFALVTACQRDAEDDAANASNALEQHGCTTADAANDDAGNLRKYERYRARLRAEFVKVSAGDEPGTNLPASERRGGKLVWSDTTILVGQYLGMLATEYALYADRRPDEAATTLAELHYALKAIDRLDRRAESYFRPDGSSAPSDLNGFFVRDDVERGFLEDHPISGASEVESGTTAPYGGKPGYGSTEMSQDQVWHLLLGLSLVKKLVPVATDIDGERVDFRMHAKQITFRVLSYMRQNDDWRTQNPVFRRDVLRGGDWDARDVFSYGFATAGNWILSADAPDSIVYPDLHDDSSRGAELAFRAARVFKKDNYNQRSLATVGDINYFTGVFDSGSALWKLEHQTLSEDVFKYEHFPLVYVLLHRKAGPGATRLSRDLYGGLLNAAPPQGTFNHDDGTHSCAWSSTSRLVWPESNNAHGVSADYSGIDYLFLHNLYQLVFNAPPK